MRVLDVLVRDGGQTSVARADFIHATLLVKAFDGTMDASTGVVFDDCPQLRITLAHDFVQVRRWTLSCWSWSSREEGPAVEQLQRAERCLANWKRLKQ